MGSNNLTEKEITALAIITRARLERYCIALETYSGAKIVDNRLIDIITNMGREVNDHLSDIQYTYLDDTLPPLRKLRAILNILVQRAKGGEIGNVNLDNLFRTNLTVISDFFNRFNLPEELSLPPNSNEDRPLNQRIINPYADDSKDYRTTVREMARTCQSLKEESNLNWRNLAESIRDQYEGKSNPTDKGTETSSELFLEGIAKLREREAKYKLSEGKAQQLSNVPLTKEEQRNKDIDSVLDKISTSILDRERREKISNGYA